MALLFLKMDAADFIFLGGASIGALVLILILNPLTSWVSWLLKKNKDQ